MTIGLENFCCITPFFLRWAIYKCLLYMCEKLCVKNNTLRTRVLDLERRHDESEQCSRLNTIEINGIPEQAS